MHCFSTDVWAQVLRKCSRGLSATTFRNCEYFFASTPKMSPPTVSTATPTDVQTLTRRYMKRFLREKSAGDEYPLGWLDVGTQDPPNVRELVEVPGDRVVMLDGDSGHVLLLDPIDPILASMVTHTSSVHDTMRFRTRSNDAPELETAFRLYGEAGSSRPLDTVHSGVESLRCARRIIARARHIYLHLPGEASGRGCAAKKDLYGRFLLDIWLQPEDGGPLRLLPEVLAESGHTVPILTGGLDKRIYDAMVNARERRIGLFRLPDETRAYPCRPWDLRKENNAAMDDDHQCADDATLVRHQPHGAVEEPVTFFRVFSSTKATEGFVYPAPSTIRGAGFGLFLRPRYDTIAAGSYLCSYATEWTQRRPYAEAGSYLLEVVHNGKLRFYDASNYDGVNLGRFANQRGVLRSLKRVQVLADVRNYSEFRQEDWKQVNEEAAEQANARYVVARGGSLEVIAVRDFEPSANPTEIFTTYGDLRHFWIAAIVREPERFPPAMVEIVRFLFNSPHCNWTLAQKQSWGNCEDLIDGDGRLRTL